MITACSNDPIEPEFKITGSNFELMSEGGEISIDVIHNVSYSISIDGSWISQNRSKGSDTEKLVFSVAENPTNDSRKGSITFTSPEAGATAVVNVSQHGLFEIYYTNFFKSDVLNPVDTADFGAKIISNTYKDGKGTIKFSGPITQIGDNAFYNRAISSIDLPNTITRIGKNAFAICQHLKTLEIPNSVTTIDEGAFDFCVALENITLPDNLKAINDHTFEECLNLKKISLPNSIVEIGDYAFMHSGLTEITIPEKVTKIGEFAFYLNTRLNKITIPSGVTEIKDATFGSCWNLKEFTIPEGVKTIGIAAFEDCTWLAEIKIPSSVTSISREAFKKCNVLKEVKVPAGVKTIESDTFYGCIHLVTVELPASITTISKAFDGCESLTALKCLATNPPALTLPEMESGTYEFNLPNLKIYVPEGSVEAYRNADVWKNYADIIFPIQ